MTAYSKHYDISLINELDIKAFREKLGRLSSSRTWLQEMENRRPFTSVAQILEDSADIWWHICTQEDWIESFNGRPLIGDQQSFANDLWCAIEDAHTIAAPKEVAEELIRCNKPYEEKFGYVWILLCEGLTPEQQLHNYKRRIDNDLITELHENSVEDFKVTTRRLRLCLCDDDPYDQVP